jgi:hypothetical protein
MAHAWKKPSAVLTKGQAIDIFRLSLTHSSKEKKPTAVSVSRAFNINEKTVRDIWSARTWHDETLPLDVNRTPRAAKKIGRPPGKIDSKPRKPRTVKSLSSTPQTQATDNAEPKSPLNVASGDSSHDHSEIFDLSCDDYPTISSQPAQESFPVQMQQICPGLLHGRLHSAPSIKGHGPFASARRVVRMWRCRRSRTRHSAQRPHTSRALGPPCQRLQASIPSAAYSMHTRRILGRL